MENSTKVPQIIKLELPYDPSVPLLEIYLKERKSLSQIFIAALFAIAKIWKQPKCSSTDEWIKIWYINNGILFSHEKEVNPAICNNRDEPGGHYTK